MSWFIDLLGSREWLLFMLIVIVAAALLFPERSLKADPVDDRDIRD